MAKIRNACRPNKLSVGTRSKKAISSSTVMGASLPALHKQPASSCVVVCRASTFFFGISQSQMVGTGQDKRGHEGNSGSRHQLISACFGDQDGWGGRVLFDLLTKSIDVCLQGVGGDAGVVAPHFLQQRLARDRTLTCA